MLSFLFIGFVRFILLLICLIMTAGCGRPCRYRCTRDSVSSERVPAHPVDLLVVSCGCYGDRRAAADLGGDDV